MCTSREESPLQAAAAAGLAALLVLAPVAPALAKGDYAKVTGQGDTLEALLAEKAAGTGEQRRRQADMRGDMWFLPV